MNRSDLRELGFDGDRLARVGQAILRDIEAGRSHGAALTTQQTTFDGIRPSRFADDAGPKRSEERYGSQGELAALQGKRSSKRCSLAV